ncbi:hypothetical protein EP7_004347 [Isosphaeraceae bacterium EP7]
MNDDILETIKKLANHYADGEKANNPNCDREAVFEAKFIGLAHALDYVWDEEDGRWRHRDEPEGNMAYERRAAWEVCYGDEEREAEAEYIAARAEEKAREENRQP